MPRPLFKSLWESYPAEMHPCDGGWANQCAIRLSLALNGEGSVRVAAGNYSEPKCKHGHARGAESLANWLYHRIGRPKVWTKGEEAKQAMRDKTGIVFFKDCSIRPETGFQTGDHIDLWFLKAGRTFSDDSNKSKEVWFWELA